MISDAPCTKIYKEVSFLLSNYYQRGSHFLANLDNCQKSLLPTFGRTRIKNKTNSKIGIHGEFEKVKFCFTLGSSIDLGKGMIFQT